MIIAHNPDYEEFKNFLNAVSNCLAFFPDKTTLESYFFMLELHAQNEKATGQRTFACLLD